MNEMILITGDHHGDWDSLFRKIYYNKIQDCVLICVGDLGIGFLNKEKQLRQFDHLNNKFKKNNIVFYGIRGNHDDPKYFNGDYNYSNFKLVPDYTVLEFNNQKFQLVGGAVSIDRILRKEGVSYWKDEKFILDLNKAEECDVLITHSAPNWIGPFDKNGITVWCHKDPTLWDECVEERKQMNLLIKKCKPKRHYCGHFHIQAQIENEGCLSSILDILEIVEHR